MNTLDDRAAAALDLRDIGKRFGDARIGVHQPRGGGDRADAVALRNAGEVFAALRERDTDLEMIGQPGDFLSEGMICTIQLYEGAPLAVALPQSVVMTVVEADPVVKGQTASSSYKSGKLENGRRVMIPPHVAAGTKIVVNTADGSYLERAKD